MLTTLLADGEINYLDNDETIGTRDLRTIPSSSSVMPKPIGWFAVPPIGNILRQEARFASENSLRSKDLNEKATENHLAGSQMENAYDCLKGPNGPGKAPETQP
ncbi:hypothetical protein KM043_002297 [Ampulex compressa]|nr:hypothetical protein KM043_002297 [Ampulex compressa]